MDQTQPEAAPIFHLRMKNQEFILLVCLGRFLKDKTG